MIRFKPSSISLVIPGLILTSVIGFAAQPANPPKPCPASNTLGIVMVGNGDMRHKSLKYPNGSAWDISYTYSINGGSWGGAAGPIAYVNQSGWALYGVENSTGKEVWRSYCNYEAFQPSYSHEKASTQPAWKFSLYEQYFGDLATESEDIKEVEESTSKVALPDSKEAGSKPAPAASEDAPAEYKIEAKEIKIKEAE